MGWRRKGKSVEGMEGKTDFPPKNCLCRETHTLFFGRETNFWWMGVEGNDEIPGGDGGEAPLRTPPLLVATGNKSPSTDLDYY